MNLQRNAFKWTGVIFLLAVLMSFTFLLPSVFAQGGAPTPIPETTPEPFEVPELELEFGAQSLMSLQSGAELGGDWAAQVNISDTEGESFKPKIDTDNDGNLHMIWRETINGKQEIFYTQMIGLAQTMPVNVSNSPSFNSDSPQLVVDSTGVAHIVWQEQDNDHGDDYETHYSNCERAGDEETGYTAVCTDPAILSNGQACSIYTGDWKAVDPLIGIDGNDTLMVTWMSYEPNPKIYIMYSRWSALGSPPSNRTGCHVTSGLYYYPSLTGDTNGNFHLVMMTSSYSVFYSKYSGGGWSAAQSIGTGAIPVIHVDQNNKIHAAWWDLNGPPKYRSKEGNGTTWSTVENVFSSTRCSDLSLITDGDDLPRLACAAGAVYEASRQASGWTESVIIQSMAGQPNLVKDSNNPPGLHLVWSDSRSGSWDTFYSPTYTCEGISPATAAGQAVLSEIQNADDPTPFLNYCKNLVDEVIYVPAKNGVEAFREWADFASSAKNEVAFTVMFWDKGHLSSPVPGEEVLVGIKQLYDDAQNVIYENKYPHGMKVRILLGVQYNPISIDPRTDLRSIVLDQLYDLEIPLHDVLPNGSAWKVEVALYKFGEGPALSPGIHSHVKLMVVDSNRMIVSGYHPQFGFQTNTAGDAENHDLGIKVSGPITTNGMAVFDSLWEGSEILCTEEDTFFNISSLCHTAIAENPTHWFFVPEGDDIVLPLYRDSDSEDKIADQAVRAAIESADGADAQVYVIQNRFGVPGDHYVFQYNEGTDWLEYADAVLKEALENTDVRILVSKDNFNLNYYNVPSLKNFVVQYHQDCGSHEYQNCDLKNINDLIRFYHPSTSTTSTPGLHAKAFMIDEEFLVIGSQNFDHSAFGDSVEDFDLVEYSVGIENDTIITDFITDSANGIWEDSGGFLTISQNESLVAGIQQANPGDVIALESGTYEISSTLNIPEGITLVGLDATIVPAPNFSSEAGGLKLAKPALQTSSASLLRITGSNVTLMGLTLQDSPGYAIEIGDGSTAVENIHISNTLFENNALGGIHVQGSASYTVENNTFVGGSSGVTITVNATATGIIRNNIFAGQNIAPVQILSTDDGTVEYSYNLFYDCAGNDCAANWHTGNLGSASSAHDNLFDIDPLFVNPALANYRLYPNSPAIDAGDPAILHEFLFDGDGNDELRIDIGAFEYGVIPNVAPIVNAGDDQTVNLGDSLAVNAEYSDADSPEGHFARIDWGDGIVEDAPVTMTDPGAGEVTSEHTYSNAGEYTVEVCVTDLYGSVGCDTTIVTVTLSSVPVTFYLHGNGSNANPPTLYLNSTAPVGTSAKYKDSSAVNFNNGNSWKDIGIWVLEPTQLNGELAEMNSLQVWLGLKNSDDQGTNFDLRVEFYKDDILIASDEALCITGITRNANLAKQVILSIDNLVPTDFNGSTDTLALKIQTRIGTNGSGSMCGGHSNAVGLRLYFDALHRPSSFEGAISP